MSKVLQPAKLALNDNERCYKLFVRIQLQHRAFLFCSYNLFEKNIGGNHMKTTGFIRGYMSKNLKGEKFIEHVATCIEQQLQEWDPNYQVQVIHLANYEIVIKNNNVICNLTISKNELVNLQS